MGKIVRVTLPSGNKTIGVPVDDNGKPDLVALARMSDSSPKHAYNDYEDKANTLFSADDLTLVQAALWINNQDRYDIAGLDVAGGPRRNTSGYTGREKIVQERVTIYALPHEEKELRSMLDNSFTEQEQEALTKGGLNVQSRPLLAKGVLGQHQGNTIRLDRSMGKTGSTFIHEGIHHLRQEDGSREGIAKRPSRGKYSLNDWKSVEESATVAEEMARAKDWKVSGYYANVPVLDKQTHRWRAPSYKEQEQMAKEDRMLFTNGTGKALTGNAAIRSVEENWANSHIARLRLGKSQAINLVQNADPSALKYTKKGKKQSSETPKKTATTPAKKSPAKTGVKKTSQTTLADKKKKSRATKSKTGSKKKSGGFLSKFKRK